MKTYTVKYEIEVDAETDHDAALQVEHILKEIHYRPHLIVIDATGKKSAFDLEQEK